MEKNTASRAWLRHRHREDVRSRQVDVIDLLPSVNHLALGRAKRIHEQSFLCAGVPAGSDTIEFGTGNLAIHVPA